ncbi:kinesin-like protein KIFC1 [Polypterus senegalus]|uniref:kinesin-like protein KIFC1 n=1 Tax=Polypterus senegalus TaxID=55291 RepID=UPI001962A5D5|nr:kinesin-like protein KIFC1 [Polypterus senegalus]
MEESKSVLHELNVEIGVNDTEKKVLSRLPVPSARKRPLPESAGDTTGSRAENPAKKALFDKPVATSHPITRKRQANSTVGVRSAPLASQRPTAKNFQLTSAMTVAAGPSKVTARKSISSKAKPAAAVAGGGSRRPAWDLKGKVSDMQNKVSTYQDKLRSVNKENKEVAERLHQSKSEVTELRMENSSLHDRLRICEGKLQLMTELQRERDYLAEEKRNLNSINESLKGEVSNLQSVKLLLTTQLDTAELHLRSKTAELLEKGEQLETAKQEIVSLKSMLSEVSEKLHKGEMDRRKLHNQILELKGNIRVFCRVRPLLSSDHADKIEHVQFPNNDEKSILLARTEESHIGRDGKDQLKYNFSFDRVFPPYSSQQEVFEEISLLVQSALDGYNVCIFAYGQTGSGKTYTMEGPDQLQDDTMGMIPRAVHQVFNSAEELKDQGWTYKFTASFLEIYNETIRDLLVNKTAKKMEHEIKRPASNSTAIYVSNLKYLNVETVEEVLSLIKVAKQNRATARTMMNDQSSRSHSVFQLKIEGVNEVRNITCNSTLSLIDLAGSERIDKSQSQGDRLKETKAINCSLSNLGSVFIALANKENFVPYRNSKLTFLLQNCLGGNSKTLMFVNISPENDSFGESLNSLRFASKVNECVIGTAVANRK